ncbi:MAG: LUD domain-containing protein [Deltaproteobacteria bacterium]|nr:LUD domain-containing protein [Deltaproteobacteria bacterium]MBW2361908.1 LUD domain-containing protein [Deltaproteobacteria bacterium]
MARSRESVLAAVRRSGAVERPLPEIRFAPPLLADPVGRFGETLSEAGGELRQVASAEGVGGALAGLPALAEARRVVSGVAAFASRHPDGAPVVPHDLLNLDTAVAAGAPAVAENGAVWVVPGDILGRAALFLAEHLVLVVPRTSLVSTLHEAYAVISAHKARFGCFIAGPSKTADIEQALVIGAHGPRTLTVLLYGEEP